MADSGQTGGIDVGAANAQANISPSCETKTSQSMPSARPGSLHSGIFMNKVPLPLVGYTFLAIYLIATKTIGVQFN